MLSFLLAASLALASCSWEHSPRIPVRVRSSALFAHLSFEKLSPAHGYAIATLGAPPGAHPQISLAVRLSASLDGRANRSTEVVTSFRALSLVRALDGSPVLPLAGGRATDAFVDGELRLPLDSSGSADVAIPISDVPVRDGDVEALCSGPLRFVGEAFDVGLGETIPVTGEPFVFDCDARHVDASLAVLDLRVVPPTDPALGVAELHIGLAEHVSVDAAAAAATLWLSQGVSPIALHDAQGERLVPQGDLQEPLEQIQSSPAGPVAIARASEVIVTRQSRRYLRDATLVGRLCAGKVRVVDDLVLDEVAPEVSVGGGLTAWGGSLWSEPVTVDCHELAPP